MPPKKKDAADDQDNLFKKGQPLAPGEREALLAKRKAAAESGDPVLISSGHMLGLEIFGCTIEGDEIHCSVRCDGSVIRPGMTATAKGQTVRLVIPAKVEHDG